MILIKQSKHMPDLRSLDNERDGVQKRSTCSSPSLMNLPVSVVCAFRCTQANTKSKLNQTLIKALFPVASVACSVNMIDQRSNSPHPDRNINQREQHVPTHRARSQGGSFIPC